MDTDRAKDRSLGSAGSCHYSEGTAETSNKKICRWERRVCCHTYRSWKIVLLVLLPVVFDILRAEDSSGYEAHSIAIVVSSLTALMMEQREKFTTQIITAEFVSELQQDLDTLHGVREGKYQLVYIHVRPESLQSNAQWRSTLLSTAYQRNFIALLSLTKHFVLPSGKYCCMHPAVSCFFFFTRGIVFCQDYTNCRKFSACCLKV